MIESVSAVGPVSASLTSGVMKAPQGANTLPGADMSFEKILGNVISDGVATLQQGESVAVQGLLGQAPPFKVVQGVMAAQQVLHGALAIRDKAVSAYQEIAHMTI